MVRQQFARLMSLDHVEAHEPGGLLPYHVVLVATKP